eukprot:1161333-Pelagomonas_calceolata.AAC.4
MPPEDAGETELDWDCCQRMQARMEMKEGRRRCREALMLACTVVTTPHRYELDAELVATARQAISQHPGAARLCQVLQGDASTADVSSATIIAL